MIRKVLIFGLIVSPLLWVGLAALSTVFYSQEQALALAFEGAEQVEKKTHILSAAQAEEIERLSSSALDSRVVTLHTARKQGKVLGYAHIDVHTVRTRPEALLIVLDPAGNVSMVKVLAFQEPLEYMPIQRWYDLFSGLDEEDKLRVGHDVDAVTGATLTTHATTDAVRRMFAYYSTLLKPALTESGDQ